MASVLSTKKWVGIFFPPLTFQTWKHINIFFFQQKNVSLVPGHGKAAEKEKPACRGEGGEVTDGS